MADTIGGSIVGEKFCFGIGCFHFGVKKAAPFKFEGKEYIKELLEALQTISNIDNVSIHCEEEFEIFSMDIKKEVPNIENGYGFFPYSQFMRIEFEIYIPFQIQAQILKKEIERLKTFTEKFRVWIRSNFFFPVTFVEPVNPSQESSPSSAVRIVREFLEREFKDSKSDYIRFESLGPSPFHADCFVEPREAPSYGEIEWRFDHRYISRKGFNKVMFSFNSKFFTETVKAKRALVKEILSELGFFYYVVQTEVVKMNKWTLIENLVKQLIDIHRKGGIRNFIRKIFVSHKELNEAFISIAEFESNELFLHSVITRNYRNVYSGNIDTYFQPYIDQEIKGSSAYPTKQANQLMSLFESRRIKRVEIFVLLISAMIGGVIGSLVTILLSK